MDDLMLEQNKALFESIVSALRRSNFEGDADALAKYVLALLETYSLEHNDTAISESALYRGKCAEDLNDFLADESAAFVDELFDLLKQHGLKTSAGPAEADGDAAPTSDGAVRSEMRHQGGDKGDRRNAAPAARGVDDDVSKGEATQDTRGRDRFSRERPDPRGESTHPAGARGDRHSNRRERGRPLNRRGGDERRKWRSDERRVPPSHDGADGPGMGMMAPFAGGGNSAPHGTAGGNLQGAPLGALPTTNAPQPGFPPFMPPMPQLPPGFMEAMAMAAARGNPAGGPHPPNPFMGLSFPHMTPMPMEGGAEPLNGQMSMSHSGGGVVNGGGGGAPNQDLAAGRGGHGGDGTPTFGQGRGGRGFRGAGGAPSGGAQRNVRHEAARTAPSANLKTLFVRKLPPESLNVGAITEYFQKFGQVVDVQLRPTPNPDRAFVEFSTHEEAVRAIGSVEAVMGNRHVRLDWAREYEPHDGTGQADGGKVHGEGGSGGGTRGGAFTQSGTRGSRRGRGRGDFRPAPTQVNVSAQLDDGTRESDNADGEKPAEAAKEFVPIESAQDVNDRKRREVIAAREEQEREKRVKLQDKNEIRRQILSHQKRLLEKLETDTNMPPEEKKRILDELKAVTAQLSAKAATAPQPTQEATSAAKAGELASVTGDTNQSDVHESHKFDRGSGFRGRRFMRGRGSYYRSFRGWSRGRGRGRGRGGYSVGNMSLDLRPRALIVDGAVGDTPATRLRIRSAYQNVDNIDNTADGHLRVNFLTRAAAEAALQQERGDLGADYVLRWEMSGQPSADDANAEEGEEGDKGLEEEAEEGEDGYQRAYNDENDIEVDYEE